MGRASSSRRTRPLIKDVLLALLLGAAAGLLIGAGLRFARAPKPGAPERSSPLRLSGFVDIRPDLKKSLRSNDALFIIVTRPEQAAPLAVRKIQPVSFPLFYSIGPEHVMLPGQTVSGPLVVRARLDRDGEANSPQQGDLTGEAPEPVGQVSEEVHILIDSVVS